MRTLLLAPVLLLAAPATAAERRYSVSDFDRVRLDAPVRVTLATGRSPSARATGPQAALDALKVEVQGRMLVIGRNVSSWTSAAGESGPLELVLSTQGLRAASVNGAGLLAIDALRGGTVQLTLGGPGALEVAALDADNLSAALVGEGRMTLGGKARAATLQLRGGGTLGAGDLVADHLRVGADGTGAILAQARATANVQASGTGAVTVAGTPACTVKANGSAMVRCGKGQAPIR